MPLYGYVMNEYWCDVGDYDSYIETHRDVFVDSNKYYLLNIGGKDGIWFGKKTP